MSQESIKINQTGQGGTCTTGNLAKSMLNSTNRFLLTQGMDNLDLRFKVDTIILNMGVILAFIISNKKVKVAEFNEFCVETSLAVKRVPWIKPTPAFTWLLDTVQS